MEISKRYCFGNKIAVDRIFRMIDRKISHQKINTFGWIEERDEMLYQTRVVIVSVCDGIGLANVRKEINAFFVLFACVTK